MNGLLNEVQSFLNPTQLHTLPTVTWQTSWGLLLATKP